MFNLLSLFSSNSKNGNMFLTKEQMAEMLRTNPDKLDEFEHRYKTDVLSEEQPKDFFEVNSKQMAEHMANNENVSIDMTNLVKQIVNEFVTEASVYRYDRVLNTTDISTGLPCKSCIDRKIIDDLPDKIRPQATVSLQKRDIGPMSYPELLYFYKESLNTKNNVQKRRYCYDHFRQGLDILDLDPITYEIIGTNPISIGYWFPKLVEGNKQHHFFKIPSTTIVKVPMNLLQLTRVEYKTLTRTTLNIVDRFCEKTFKLNPDGDYFIKTGTYSSKFDFRNCRVHSPKEVRELGEYLLFIHHQALMRAGLLCINKNGNPAPGIYGMSTTNEWCVREYIKDVENNPTIYKGLPLHTEYRAFVDFDTQEILGIYQYWDPDVMKKRFGDDADESIHSMHDYLTYQAHEEILTKRFDENKDLVRNQLEKLIPDIKLTGQWSIDIMQNGNDFWLIDMATAERSAFYEKIPSELKNPQPENWLPDFSNK